MGGESISTQLRGTDMHVLSQSIKQLVEAGRSHAGTEAKKHGWREHRRAATRRGYVMQRVMEKILAFFIVLSKKVGAF